jgi:hypothetical protein
VTDAGRLASAGQLSGAGDLPCRTGTGVVTDGVGGSEKITEASMAKKARKKKARKKSAANHGKRPNS